MISADNMVLSANYMLSADTKVLSVNNIVLSADATRCFPLITCYQLMLKFFLLLENFTNSNWTRVRASPWWTLNQFCAWPPAPAWSTIGFKYALPIQCMIMFALLPFLGIMSLMLQKTFCWKNIWYSAPQLVAVLVLTIEVFFALSSMIGKNKRGKRTDFPIQFKAFLKNRFKAVVYCIKLHLWPRAP
jgi:hypothetical protein